MTNSKVLTGLDRLFQQPKLLSKLRNCRVALLVNPTSVDQHLNHIIDLLLAQNVEITHLFGPEHGIRSEVQDMESVETGRDPITGIRTKSLYGTTFDSLKPTDEDLADVDLLIADIQDIGSRYYTYAYTIGLTMEACGRNDIPVWVVDRPNPISAAKVAGGVLQPEFKSFVGMQPLPTRPGMTMGELALFFNKFGGWCCDLTVLEMEGYRRSMWFDETHLPWVIPSPNMPTLDTATVYPGQCILEGTELSEGRGTTRPFEFFGAPFIDANALKKALDDYQLPGVAFRPISFRPMFQKCAGEYCSGVQVHVTDREKYCSISMTYAILQICIRDYPEQFHWRDKAYEFVDDVCAIDLLIGNRAIKEAIVEQAPINDIVNLWQDDALDEFTARRAEVMLYR